MSKDTEAICEEILGNLEQLYRDYCAVKPVAHKGFEAIFAKWMRAGSDQIAPADQAFLHGVRQAVATLAEELSELAAFDRGTCEKIAGRGLAVLFAPKSKRPATDIERYLVIAECFAAPLFPHASLPDLHAVRNTLARRVPKRMMLPKELELLTLLEERM